MNEIKQDENNITIALVCVSNQSMAAHKSLVDSKIFPLNTIFSYGIGNNVKLPGKSFYKPNVYEFGTPYTAMLQDLIQKDEKLLIKK
jgi:RNA polymerase II subunit A C-terminal domain phosphatase SSU72